MARLKNEVSLLENKSQSGWSVNASFDDKGRLAVCKHDLDDEFYIHVAAGQIAALKRVLNRQCKPRAKSGDLQADILKMLETLFVGDVSPFEALERFLDEFGIGYSQTHWLSE